MSDDFHSSQPIYLQLVQRICRQIVNQERAAGDKLPSVREMAIQFGVNPNTIQRVYSELERLTVVETKRGQGTFVTESQSRLQQLRSELMKDHITSFLRDMTEMGFSPDEIIQGIKDHLED